MLLIYIQVLSLEELRNRSAESSAALWAAEWNAQKSIVRMALEQRLENRYTWLACWFFSKLSVFLIVNPEPNGTLAPAAWHGFESTQNMFFFVC